MSDLDYSAFGSVELDESADLSESVLELDFVLPALAGVSVVGSSGVGAGAGSVTVVFGAVGLADATGATGETGAAGEAGAVPIFEFAAV